MTENLHWGDLLRRMRAVVRKSKALSRELADLREKRREILATQWVCVHALRRVHQDLRRVRNARVKRSSWEESYLAGTGCRGR